jgi:hypothetical protein
MPFVAHYLIQNVSNRLVGFYGTGHVDYGPGVSQQGQVIVPNPLEPVVGEFGPPLAISVGVLLTREEPQVLVHLIGLHVHPVHLPRLLTGGFAVTENLAIVVVAEVGASRLLSEYRAAWGIIKRHALLSPSRLHTDGF